MSAIEADTDNSTLTYTTNFEITGNQLKIKIVATAIMTTFPITISNSINTVTQGFSFTKTIVDSNITP